MSEKTSYIYLHGFASSPSSSKAKYFEDHLLTENVHVHIPDLNGSNFEQLTLSSQLQLIDAQFDSLDAVHVIEPSDKKVVMIGSSMGGLLAVLKSIRCPQVAAVVLMAPGFGLMKRWPDLFGENTLDDWKQQGFLNVYHHGASSYLPLGYGFIEDAARYQTDNLQVNVPTILFHGRSDATVPIVESEDFYHNNVDQVEFHPLDDDHQLLASLDYIWDHSRSFLKRLNLL
jgi:alpha-beta hydrolase superfamily lysophospholipase